MASFPGAYPFAPRPFPAPQPGQQQQQQQQQQQRERKHVHGWDQQQQGQERMAPSQQHHAARMISPTSPHPTSQPGAARVHHSQPRMPARHHQQRPPNLNHGDREAFHPASHGMRRGQSGSIRPPLHHVPKASSSQHASRQHHPPRQKQWPKANNGSARSNEYSQPATQQPRHRHAGRSVVAPRHVSSAKRTKSNSMMSFYEDSAERGQQDLYDNKRARVRLESLEKKVVEIAAERDDGAAVFGLSAKEKHELYELQKSASWTVFEAMLWILYRSGFVYRSVRLLTKLYQTTFRPKGNQDEVELLLMSPLFRPFLKVTAHNGSLCFRLDPMRIQATLRASNFGAADIKFPPLLPGVRGDDQFLLETNSESWVYALHPLVRAAMLAKANTGFQPGFPYTGMLLPSAHNFVGELIDLDKRVPLWDALLVVLDLVDTMPAGNWERKHALLEIYISVAKAIVGTFDKIMMDLQDDAATLCRLASARSQSTYHRSLLTAAPSAAGDAVETTDTIPANISVYDDVDDAGSDVTDSNESDLDDPAASPPGLQRSESSEAKPKWHMQDGDKGWNEKGQSRGSEWRDSGDGSRMNEKGRYRDHGSYSEYESQRGNKYNSPYGYAGRNQSCSPERNGRHDVRR